MKIPVSFTVNGERVEAEIEPRTHLGDFLRDELRLTATHLGCEHGVCGACTVHVDGRTARACILLAVQADGCAVTTAEGLADDGPLTAVQEGFWRKHGMQCGFCTPGFLMTVTELLREHPEPSDEQIADALGGNLCRCTGYTKILEAVHEAIQLSREGAPA
jgi:carbon-monoxide dehydrogenase small subunit